MKGAWVCAACAEAHDIDTTGTGYAQRGWCGVGQHTVNETIRWAPEAEAAAPALIVAPTPPVKGQLSLF